MRFLASRDTPAQGRSRLQHGAALMALVPLVLAASPPSTAPAPLEDEWYVLKLQDQPCGYLHSEQKRVGGEVHTRVTMKVEVSRGSVQVAIGMEQSHRETVAGEPLSFRTEAVMAQMPVVYEGTVKNGKIRLVTEQAGARKEATYDFDPEVKFSWGQQVEQRRRGLKPGTTFTVKTYDPSLREDAALPMEFRIGEKEAVKVLGRERSLTHVISTVELPNLPLITHSWVDEEATPVISTIDLGIFKITMYQATREEALKDVDAPEMFINSLVPVARPIGSDARRVELRLRVPQDNGLKMPDLPQTAMQRVRRVNDHELRLTIQRLDWEKIRGVTATAQPSDQLRPYLQASTYLDIEDRRIRRLARQGVRGCRTPAEKADALRKFVTDYVKDKELDVGFATASEVARTRRGDCSEHGVLLAALARAAGLPARGVSGIIEVPRSMRPAGGESAFGYHMWTQVYIGDQWVDIDAAMRETDCNPTHIALALMPLNEEGIVGSATSLLSLLGRLQIDVIRVEN